MAEDDDRSRDSKGEYSPLIDRYYGVKQNVTNAISFITLLSNGVGISSIISWFVYLSGPSGSLDGVSMTEIIFWYVKTSDFYSWCIRSSPFIIFFLSQLYFSYVNSGDIKSAYQYNTPKSIRSAVLEGIGKGFLLKVAKNRRLKNSVNYSTPDTESTIYSSEIAQQRPITFKHDNEHLALLRQAAIHCENEINHLKRTANINLFIGIIIFACSLTVFISLLYAPFYAPIVSDKLNESVSFTVSKVVFSASFGAISFFFLSTYRNAINQVRHYRNEVTNILFWQSAMYMSERVTTTAERKQVIAAFLRTERNFVLKKGETTAETQLHSFSSEEVARLSQLLAQHEAHTGRTGAGKEKAG